MDKPKKAGEGQEDGRLVPHDTTPKKRLITITARRTDRQAAYFAAKTDLYAKAAKIIGIHDFYEFLKLPEGEQRAKFYAIGLAAEYEFQGTAYINADTEGR